MFITAIIIATVAWLYVGQCRLERERVEECRVANAKVEERVADFMKNKGSK
jgi:hypothetical protein